MSWRLPDKATPGGEAGRSRREPGVGATRHAGVYHSGRLMRAAWWWIDRWRKSTAYTDMTLAEQGAYRNLLDELWLRDGLIPNDERILAKVCGDALSWPAVREKVLARFRLTPEGWRNDTHDEVSAWPKAQAEKGRKRAEGAAREGGRFTSPPPAEHQPESPAHDQPPYSVSVLRTPSPLPNERKDERSSQTPGRANPLLGDGDRPRLETECLSLVRRLSELTGEEPTEVIARAAGYEGAKRTKVNPASMSDDRLILTVRDLRADVAAEEKKRDAAKH